jgi:predicted DCC family thiol-disulfide oxidoreductase YuxK
MIQQTDKSQINKDKAIVLFDGICNFCSSSVLFIIRRDPKGYFRFAALQTESGATLIKKHDINSDETESIILIDNNKVYYRSSAALRIARKLKGGWKLFYIAIIIPPFIRNFFYDIVARNRYCWFGKRDYCFVPEPSMKERFISDG